MIQQNYPGTQPRSFSFILFILVSIFLSFCLISIQYTPIVTASTYIPDSGSYSGGTLTNWVFGKYSASNTYKAVQTASYSWAFLFSLQTADVVSSSFMTGWDHRSSVKAVRRTCLYFDTSILSDEAQICWATLSISGTTSGTDTDSYYICLHDEGDPPVQSTYHTRNPKVSSSFDADGSIQQINVSAVAINPGGLTCLQIVSAYDWAISNPPASTDDYCLATWSNLVCQLNVVWIMDCHEVISAHPVEKTVSTQPVLSATVKGGGQLWQGGYNCYLLSNSTGAWFLRDTKVVTGWNTVQLTYHDTTANSNGNWYWRVQIVNRVFGTSGPRNGTLWVNYTFNYTIGSTSGGGEEYFFIRIRDQRNNYSFGEQFIIETCLPRLYWMQPHDQQYWKIWVSDPNGNIGLIWNQPYMPWSIPGYACTPPMTLHYTPDVTGGNWTLWFGVRYESPESVGRFTTCRFNVTSYDNRWRIYPLKYTTSDQEPQYYRVIGQEGDAYINLINAYNGSIAIDRNGKQCNQSIHFWVDGDNGQGGFGQVAAGKYYLTVLNDTLVLKNRSRYIIVENTSMLNAYYIQIPQGDLYVGHLYTITVGRSKGVKDWVVNIRDVDGRIIYDKIYSTDSMPIEIKPRDSGHYIIDVYDIGSSTGSSNHLQKTLIILPLPDITNEEFEDLFPPLGAVWEPILPVVGFAVLLGIGAFAAYHTQSGIVLPCVLFSGMFIMSIPGTMITIFPPITLFIMGIMLILIFFLLLRR